MSDNRTVWVVVGFALAAGGGLGCLLALVAPWTHSNIPNEGIFWAGRISQLVGGPWLVLAGFAAIRRRLERDGRT